MSQLGRPSKLGRIEDDAIRLVQKMATGEATPEQIERWCGRSEVHAKAYTDAERIWKRIAAVGRARSSAEVDYLGPLREFAERSSAMNRRRILSGGAAVFAAAAAYGVVNPPLGLWPSFSELRADFRTGTGEQRAIRIADAVAVHLNTQTSLLVRASSKNEDRVELVAGEASFATAPGTTRSLAVVAANGTTVAGPGRFDIRYVAAGAPVVVTCFQGQLRVECEGSAFDLQPGQRVSYGDGGLGSVSAVDPALESEWQRGIVEFRNTPLAEAVEEINRYRPGRIILINSTLGHRTLSGRFRIDQMEKVLLQLEHVFSTKIRRLPGGVVLLS